MVREPVLSTLRSRFGINDWIQLVHKHCWSHVLVPRSGSIDATVVCIFHGRPFEGNLTTGCSQHRVQPAQGAASTGCSQHMSSLWSCQLSQLKMAIKWSWSSQHRPMVPKLGWWLSHTLTMPKAHLVPLFREANWGWCSLVQLAPAKSTCIQSIELEYKRVPFVLQVRISGLHVHVSSMCHPSMSFHGWVSHFITDTCLPRHPEKTWKNIHRCSSVSCQDRWTSGTHPRVHGIHLRAKWQFGEVPDSGAYTVILNDGPLGSLQKTTW